MSDVRKSVLVVDDEEKQRNVMASFLEAAGYRVRTAQDAETALERIEKENYDLVLMDVRMPGMGGMRGLVEMREIRPTLPVILLTAYAGVRDAVSAIREGAADYLEKPIDLNELAAVVSETIGGPGNDTAEDFPPLPDDFIVASEVMKSVVREAALVAKTDATVLLTGESGTGKERVARFIHETSSRAGGPFVAVNCAAIPAGLVESELFGHIKGAFTGADATQVGTFEAASGGTILLDEVGELPLEIQPKLLRVLENGTFRRVGDHAERKSDARVIACTNRDLEKEIEGGRFREDLFWRLNVFQIRLPPLRERREEIALFARCFLKRAGRRKTRISPAALRDLEAYDWPGNVRELANIMERAAILCSGRVVLPDHLPASLRRRAEGRVSETAAGEAPDGITTVQEAERRAIREALRKTGGNRTKAAELLGISRRKLFYRLKQYGGEP